MMAIVTEVITGVQEAARRIATDWQLDPVKVEAELLREPTPESIDHQFGLFDEIEERLSTLATIDPVYVGSFWHEVRFGSRSPSSRLGDPKESNFLESLTEELWEAEEIFTFFRRGRVAGV